MAEPSGQVTPKAVWALRRREFWRAKCHMRRMKKTKDALEVLRKNYPRNATYVYPGPGIAVSNSGAIETLFDGWEKALKYRLSVAIDRYREAHRRYLKKAPISPTQDEIKAINQGKDGLANYFLDIEDINIMRTSEHIIVIGA